MHFTTGLRSGEIATIRDDAGAVLFTYRAFAGVTGIVAALVSGIVAVAGIGAVLLLLAEGAPFRAAIALLLTLLFSFVIALLVPRTNVTLYDNGQPSLTIAQRSLLPTTTYVVATANGAHLAEIRKSAFSRLGRNRWTVWHEGRFIAEAIEETLGGALQRKVAGKFSRRFETDVVLRYGGVDAGRIVRRSRTGSIDVLELNGDALDRRVAVALATLILGREP